MDNLSRAQLAEFLPNPAAIKAFESLLREVSTALPSRIDGAELDAGSAAAAAGEALAQLGLIASKLSELLLAPPPVPHAPEDHYVPPAPERTYFPLQWPTQNPRGDGSWCDLWVPDQKTFVDNVLTLRNSSRRSDGSIYGNAAVCMLDASGKERGAFGYSRNSAIQPTGYYGDTVYVEYGDAFAGDNNPSSFKLICTMAGTSPWFPGTSFVAMEADAKTGATVIRSRGGQPISLTGGYTLTDDFTAGYKGNVRQVAGGMTNTCWRIRERDTTDWAAWTTNLNDAGVPDDPAKSSWKVQQGFGGGNDSFRVARAPAGSTSFTTLFRVGATGQVTFTAGASFGYGAGSGSTATQATSKSTTVTINKPSGQITMSSEALAGGAFALFFVANSTVTTSDCVVANLRSGMTYSPNYTLRVTSIEAGGFYIVLKNETAGPLSEAVVFNFAVVKGSTS